jgi:phosphatidylserine decarboxylase
MPILKEGYQFIFPSFAAGAAFIIASRLNKLPPAAVIPCTVLGVLLIIFALFCMFFFRDPKIIITQGNEIILSPCNGTVMEINEEGDEKVVRVFLSIFNVHLQRSPVSGKVVCVSHKEGKFLAAWEPRAHIENEQNILKIQGEDGIFTVLQIAGLIARRCVSWVKPGDILKAGDKIGMIKFSSQVDIYMPTIFKINVKPGDKVKAGITVMASK